MRQKKNFQMYYLGAVNKTANGNPVGSTAEIKESVYAKDAHKVFNDYEKSSRKTMTDEEIERQAQSSINSDLDFLFELGYGKR